ncbi:MAG: hypothetical protein HY861_02565 [Chlamydiia bacterium]|nr:hypothetical protein [Chlamydiia bacterium]
MTVTSTQVSTLPQINRHITENLQDIASTLKTKSRLTNLASKVCLAAFLAIVTLAISISFGLLPPIAPFLLIGLVIATVPLQSGFIHLQTASLSLHNQYLAAQAKADALKEIQDWKEGQIQDFLKAHKIHVQDLPLDALRQIHPSAPIKALLPAIAQYHYYNDLLQKYSARHLRDFTNKMENPMLRLAERRMAWTRLEEEVIPAALQSALMLEIIGTPTLQLELESLGKCKMKPLDQRFLDRMIDHEDDYFCFSDTQRTNLTLTELYDALPDADTVRKKLFPRSEPSSWSWYIPNVIQELGFRLCQSRNPNS